MVDYLDIYRTDAGRYDLMVGAEDVDRCVIAALAALVPLQGASVIEVGVGTGRITKQLVAAGARVLGVEPEEAMLCMAQKGIAALGADPDGLVIGSLASLPFETASADLSVAGWVFGHQRSFEPERWKSTVAAGIGELQRVTRSGGWIVLFETLGTAVEEPAVRSDLAELYRYLEDGFGFQRRVLRTDYAFASAADAAAGLRFFFGDALAERVLARGWARVPEWTGCWSRRRSDR